METLEYLDLDDLRRAALVSRVFYAASWRTGLYLHRNLYMDDIQSRDCELEAANDLIKHALRKNLRLSLAVSSCAVQEEDEDISGSEWLDIIQPSVIAVFSTITAAFPVLVHLSVCVPDPFVAQLFDTLRKPAPLLRSLGIGVDWNESLSEHHVPADIFACDAPKLRVVGLRNIRLALPSASAFSRIDDARFEYTDVFAFATCISASLRVVLTLPSRSSSPRSPYASCLLTTTRASRSPRPLSDRSNAGTFPLWNTSAQEPQTSCSVYAVAWNQRWRRTYHLREGELRIRRIPGVEGRLEYLRMDNIYLVALLDFLYSGKLALLALRRLQLDFDPAWPHAAMVWPPDWADSLLEDGTTTAPFCAPEDRSSQTFAPDDRFYCLRCPALATLVLFALHAGVAVAPREVAFLGRALDQCDRPKKERAALELVGVEFQTPGARALLGRAFSSVSHYALAEEDTDRIWDEDA